MGTSVSDKAHILIDPDRVIGTRDPMIFGHFLEHFHRQIYGGVFEPGSPLADRRGFRADVIEALKKIRTPVVRWPGGCFASAYHWKDGVGKRTAVFDKAWRVEEPNTFGTDEFVEFCRAVGAEPYICTNAGSGTAEEMSDWVEYCNLREAGPWARMRRENGYPEPHNVRYWSIGNENYGSWEIGAKSAEEWARYVTEAAKMMRRPDAEIQLSAASTPLLEWNTKMLEQAGRHLDWISIHQYCVRGTPSYETCVAAIGRAEKTIGKAEHILGALDLLGKIRISFDEWNLRGWHHPSFVAPDPNLSERDENDVNSTYTMADAVFTGAFLNTCLRHCRTVGMANFSPVVNTRGAIFTHSEGIVLRSTYHVFDLYANHTSAEVLDTLVRTPTYSVTHDGGETVDVPIIDAVATLDRDRGRLDVTIVNSHEDRPADCEIELRGARAEGEATLRTVCGDSADSYNDIDRPEDVRLVSQTLRVQPERFTVSLPPHSVSALELTAGRR